MEPTSPEPIQPNEALPTPDELQRALPLSADGARFIAAARREIAGVLAGEDPRLLVIVGPCSLHDPASALEYAARLARLREQLGEELLICMRAYCEKPRTALGWKGLINDPHLDGSCDIATGLVTARKLLLALCEAGLPAATETLDPIMPAYLGDLPAWTAIGARTTESQPHRELASGLPLPVGFKNGTDGGLAVAVHAMTAARAPHRFLGLAGSGRARVVHTRGNPHTHLVLRGGGGRPNYGEADVRRASDALRAAGHNPRVLIDCSHDNSGKDPERQPAVLEEIGRQLEGGSPVLGVMIESHLVGGRQELAAGRTLRYGQSVTDACLDIERTAAVLRELAAAVRRAQRGRRARAGESLQAQAG